MGGERSKAPSAPVQQRAVSLWDMLTVFAGGSALGGALGAALVTHLSAARLALLTAWGLLLGVASTTCVRVGGGRLLVRTTSPRLPLIYAGAALWIIVAAVIASAVTRGLLALLP